MSNLSKEYCSENRYWSEKFGRGEFGNYAPTVKRKPAIETALRLGWSNGCPIARELTDPDSKYGLEWMIKRYADTNSWYRIAVYQARNNKAVQDWLSTPRLRLGIEPVGKHEPLSVPKSHLWRISPMSGVDGYATPRVTLEVIDKLGGNEGQNKAHYLLQHVANATGNNPSKYLALLSEMAVQKGVEPERVLSHVYPAGVLREQNCKVAFWDLAKSLEQHAPTVWKTYNNLPQNQKSELEIANIPQLQ